MIAIITITTIVIALAIIIIRYSVIEYLSSLLLSSLAALKKTRNLAVATVAAVAAAIINLFTIYFQNNFQSYN